MLSIDAYITFAVIFDCDTKFIKLLLSTYIIGYTDSEIMGDI